ADVGVGGLGAAGDAGVGLGVGHLVAVAMAALLELPAEDLAVEGLGALSVWDRDPVVDEVAGHQAFGFGRYIRSDTRILSPRGAGALMRMKLRKKRPGISERLPLS